MTSTRTKNLARAIQRANPGMKYTEALRHAEAGRIVLDPMAPHTEAVAEMYRAAGIDLNLTPIDLSVSREGESLDPLRIAGEDEGPGRFTDPTPHDLSPALWDGEVHPDPLTFFVGQDLMTTEKRYLRLGEVSPHILASGGTASGKTSIADVIAAQALIKPMPWDQSLHGSVVMVDPTGALARRWAGRPGVIVANGLEDAAEPDEDGNPVTGPLVMASAMEWIEVEHQRRATILARHAAATWLHLPDEVKREERLAPMIVILDEYLDHIDMVQGDSEQAQKENHASEVVTRLANWHARKGRSVGIHLVLIAQKIEKGTIDAPLLRNLPARIVTGQVGDAQLRLAFGDQDFPELVSTRVVVEGGESKMKMVPGRARIMDEPSQRIDTIQIPWFGGRSNAETLDKWLPRGVVPPNGDFSLPVGKR